MRDAAKIIALFVALSSASARIHVDLRAKAQLEIRAKVNAEEIASPANHRIKVADGEYAIARIGDLGIQPPGTEEFEFGETWTLWDDWRWRIRGSRRVAF
jgi:hypothetical protein